MGNCHSCGGNKTGILHTTKIVVCPHKVEPTQQLQSDTPDYPNKLPKSVQYYSAKPNGMNCMRRDEKDIKIVSKIIENEYHLLSTKKGQILDIEFHSKMESFVNGAWSAYIALSELQKEEMLASNERTELDPDHWFEINTSNASLFQDLSLKGIEELLPGRLFTTRMPRNLKEDPYNANAFIAKVRENSLDTVVVLAEHKEYDKYAGTDLEDFYNSIGLNVIARPFEDFSIPDQPNMKANIKDVVWKLAEGQNVLVHCAGGSGRTGMLIAGVMRNVGVKDPVTWVRRVKSVYIETQEQEDFVASLPLVLDERIAEKHPILEEAVVAEFLLNLITPGHVSEKWQDTSAAAAIQMSAEEERAIERAFACIDQNGNGEIEVCDLEEIFDRLGALRPHLSAIAVLGMQEAGQINKTRRWTKEEFRARVSQRMDTCSRHYHKRKMSLKPNMH